MKPILRLAAFALAFSAAAACSDMTALNPKPTSADRERGGTSATSSHTGSSGTKNAAGSSGAANAAGRTSVTGGRGTSVTGGAGGTEMSADVTPTRAAQAAGGSGGSAGREHATTTTRVTEGGAGLGGSAGAGGGSEPVRTKPPFFTEYVEGTGSYKALEVSIAAPGPLDGCLIRMYANGSLTATRSISLFGLLVPEIPLVVCSPQLSALVGPVCNVSEALPFNGNDALVLVCAGDVVDSIGQLGSDPGETGWGSGSSRTQDQTLRRSCALSEGDQEPTDPFDLSADGWFAAGTDAFDGLGIRCEPELDDGTGRAGGSAGAGSSAGAAGAG